jgi:DNA-binding transcriptional LysR family regulator
MKIEHLKFFLSVADCLNFTQAAKENHIAQTAISRYISNMEAELGVKLFFRNNRYVELTPEGV